MSRTNEGPAAGGDEAGQAVQLAGELRAIRDRASADARGYWLPLLLFGALICGSLPLYERLAGRPGQLGPPGAGRAGGGICVATPGHACHLPAVVGHVTVVTALGYYWQIAIPVGVLLTAAFYQWRGRRVGLRTPARGFLITGLVLGELVLLVPLLAGQSHSVTLPRLLHDTHQAGPLVIIAALLGVLAWAERSPALAATVGVYLVVALVISPFDDGGLAGGTTGAADLSLTGLRLLGLLPALVLLAGGAAALLSQRVHWHPHGPARPAAL
jgi:hypothetical protein